jgi:hypothetical protein
MSVYDQIRIGFVNRDGMTVEEWKERYGGSIRPGPFPDTVFSTGKGGRSSIFYLGGEDIPKVF